MSSEDKDIATDMAADNPSHRLSLVEGPKVNVYVGPEKRCFVVSRKLLCSHSIYCDRLLNGHFAEASGDSVNLKDDEPETFDLLIQWMHHEGFPVENRETLLLPLPLYNPVRQKALREECHILCALYCLCDKIQVPKIGEDILKKLRDLIGSGFQPRTVRMVLESVPESSALHEYVLQGVADDLIDEWGHDYDDYDELLEGPEAIEGLVKALFKRMKKKKYDWSLHQGTSWNLVPANMTGR